DQYHCRIHDNTEVDCTGRQQVRALPLRHHNYNAEEHSEGNVCADDYGTAQIAQKNPLDKENEEAAEGKIVQDRVGGYRDQPAAVIEGNYLDSRRQRPVAVDLFDFRLNPCQYVFCLFCPIHYHNGRHHVIVSIAAAHAKPRYIAYKDLRNVFYQDRSAVRLSEADILNVINLPALSQIGGTASVDKADAADVHGLLANIDRAP